MLCIFFSSAKQMDYLICKAFGFSVIQLHTNRGLRHVPQHHHHCFLIFVFSWKHIYSFFFLIKQIKALKAFSALWKWGGDGEVALCWMISCLMQMFNTHSIIFKQSIAGHGLAFSHSEAKSHIKALKKCILVQMTAECDQWSCCIQQHVC